MFPDELENPKVKEDKPWLLKYAKAVMSDYAALPSGSIGRKSSDQYALIKAYALGEQPIDKYKRILVPGDDPSNNSLVVDWSVIPIIPRLRQNVIGILEKQGYDIVINPIDPLAKSEIQDTLLEMKAKVMLRNLLPQNGIEPNMPALMPEPGEPEDLDGIEVMETGIRHRTAMEAEQVVELTFSQNNYSKVRRQLLEDLVDYGVSVTKDDTDVYSVGLRRVDPAKLVMNYCMYPDFSDLRYIGEVKTVPASKIQAMGNFSSEQMREIHAKAQTPGLMGGLQFSGGYNEWFNKGKVAYLDLELLSTDEWVREQRIDKRGNLKFGKARYKNANLNKEEYKKKTVQSVYRIKHVIGTDLCWDYGRQYDIKRDPKNVSCAKLSYHIATASIYEMKAFSRTKALIPMADQIQLAFYKLQHALNSAVPKGIAIDLSALEDVSLSGGGEKLTPKDLMDLYFQRGVMVYRRTSGIGVGQNTKWIEELQGGVGNEIAEYQTLISNAINSMRDTLGLNELVDGSTPDAKTLNGVAAMAQQGTNNALSDLFFADKQMTESVAESVIIRSQDIIKDGKGEMFTNTLGYGTTLFLKNTPDIDKYTYGVSIEDKPTVEEKAFLDNQILKAQESGQITIDDVIRLRSFKNLKQAGEYLAYKVRKNKEAAQKEQMMLAQQNAQVQQQSAMVAEQAKQQTLQLDYQLKSQLSSQEHKQKLEQIVTEGGFDLEGERISATGRIDSSLVQAKERQESNVRNNVAKLLDNDMDEKIAYVDIKEELKTPVDPLTSPEEPNLPIDNSGYSFLEEPIAQPEIQPEPVAEEVPQEIPQEVPEGFDPEGYAALQGMGV